MERSARSFSIAILVGLAALPLAAFQKPDVVLPPDFDHLTAVEPAELDAARAEIEARARRWLGDDLILHWGDRSDRPQTMLRRGGTLGFVPVDQPVEGIRGLLRAGRSVFGFSDTEIDALETSKLYDTRGIDVTHLQLTQRIAGISVFRGQLRANLDRAGGVINIGGEFFPGLEIPATPRVSAEEALFVAALGIGLTGDVPAVASSETDGERKTVFADGGEYLEPAEVRLMLAPEMLGQARLVWHVRLWEAVTGLDNLYRVLVDAQTGEAVLRERMTYYMTTPADAHGLVFDCNSPDECGQTDISFAGDPNASPLYWITDGQEETRGNNCVTRADWGGGNNDALNLLADGGKQLNFDFPFSDAYAQGGSWGDDTDAAITNGFYWGNVIHEHWWALGFDEAAGNFQDDNFGRGGLGNDHVNIDVQDGASLTFLRNNANWGPTNDGIPPRTNYFLWTDPDRDGAFEASIEWHEYGHGISTRLIGGPDTMCLGGAQGGGMGEGWGDWFAMNYFSQAGSEDGPIGIGTYATGDPNGIRRYPYAVDLGVNPLTYADLCDGGGCEVHDEGEIWAVTLWDLRHDLIDQLGWAEGRLRAEQLVIDAMKLSACSPNFVTMRDSILQADEQRYAGAHSCLIRGAFTRRGLGGNASSNGSGSGGIAGFELVAPASGLAFASDKTTLTWDPRADATGYPVARGTFGSDASANAFDDGSCQGESATESFSDGETPPSGSGFHYTVAVNDECGGSHHGTASDGTVRTAGVCP